LDTDSPVAEVSEFFFKLDGFLSRQFQWVMHKNAYPKFIDIVERGVVERADNITRSVPPI
jgi:hypothetical protein